MAETVTVLHPGTSVDGYDDPVPSWDPDDVLQENLSAFAVEPVSSTEDNDGRQAVITGLRVYFRRSWPDVAAPDRMVARGAEWQVDGQPADWRSPYAGVTGGLVVALKAVTG